MGAVFLAYDYVGSGWLIPGIIEHKGLSFVSIVNAHWLDTTGVFGIPLMKRVGFSAEKAGAVEVASFVNGPIVTPVMGGAAFLMVEFVGISYVEVIKHAFIPVVISYIALLCIVHLEALKRDMPALGEAANLARMS